VLSYNIPIAFTLFYDNTFASKLQMQLIIIPTITNSRKKLFSLFDFHNLLHTLRLTTSENDFTNRKPICRKPFLRNHKRLRRPYTKINDVVNLCKLIHTSNTSIGNRIFHKLCIIVKLRCAK